MAAENLPISSMRSALGSTTKTTRDDDIPSSTKTGADRLLSLDTFRGFTMFWIVGGGMLANALFTLSHNAFMAMIIQQLNHSPWFGLRFYDCIWPSFMLMVGVSVPFSMGARSQTQTESQQLWHAFRRAVIIFLLGSVRESISLGSPYLVELSSALQPIAIAYFVAFIVSRRSWRFQATLAGTILVSYACLIAFVPAPGIEAGSYLFDHNLVHSVDIAVLGQHHWDIWPYRDEGWGTVLVVLPSIATTLVGLIIGKLLLMSYSLKYKARVIGGIGLGLVLLGFGISPLIPIEMKMWTASYGIASAGVACLEFLFFLWLVDMVRSRKWTIIFVPFGRNAIFIYMLTSLISIQAGTNVFTSPIAAHLGKAAELFEATAALFVEWLILFWMMQRKIYVKP